MRALPRTPANDTNTLLFSLLLKSIKHCTNLPDIKRIQTHLITTPFLTNTNRHSLLNHLLFHSAFSKSNSSSPIFSYTQRLFNSIPNPDLFTYNVMIRVYASKDDNEALKLYKQMLVSEIRPDFVTFPFVFVQCGCMKSRDELRDGFGRSLHSQAVVIGVVSDVYICNTMITFYASYGNLIDARKVFDEMLYRDIVSWNSIIIGCLRCGDLDEALGLFKGMSFVKNIVTWNSIITGFVQGGRAKEALELFYEMQMVDSVSKDYMVKPDGITFANVITACGALGAIDHGKWVHGYLKKTDVRCDYVIETALVDMYGKCGHLDTAVEVFSNIRNKDVLAWTTMISAYALHGHSYKAFELFDEMIFSGVRPSQVTFVSLLSACAHSGLVDKGRWYFDTMSSVYFLQPQVHHYACMVDMLSRSGLFKEAERLIKGMPMKPDTFVLGALLGGCQIHGNMELGVKIANSLIDLEPLNHSFYVNLIDIYAKAGRFEDAKRIRSLMSDKGIKKEIAGCSLIELDGIVHEFSIRGSADISMVEVFQILNVIYCEFTRIRED